MRRVERPGRNVTGAYEVAKPKPAPRINRRAVPCPDCHVEVGVRCVRDDGAPAVESFTHRARVRLATRLHNQQRSTT